MVRTIRVIQPAITVCEYDVVSERIWMGILNMNIRCTVKLNLWRAMDQHRAMTGDLLQEHDASGRRTGEGTSEESESC